MIPQLIVHHHLGLGDHFICNGLVHHILDTMAHEVWLPTKQKNLATVKHLYEDYEQVKVIDAGDLDLSREILSVNQLSINKNVPLLKISYNGSGESYFDKPFYEQLGFDFDLRWEKFTMPLHTDGIFIMSKVRSDPTEPFILVHNSGSVGKFDLKIDSDLPVVEIDETLSSSLIDWWQVISSATEIHCIDSSVIHLADSLNLDRVHKLVYHDVGRGSKFHLKNNWQIQKYT